LGKNTKSRGVEGGVGGSKNFWRVVMSMVMMMMNW
jgi:hypothetical protein